MRILLDADLEKLFPNIGEEEQKNESNHIFNTTSVHNSTASRLYHGENTRHHCL